MALGVTPSWAASSVAGGLLNPVLTRRVGELRSLIIACGANAVIYVGIGLAPSAWPAGPLVTGALVLLALLPALLAAARSLRSS
jgi:hypothetical protein